MRIMPNVCDHSNYFLVNRGVSILPNTNYLPSHLQGKDSFLVILIGILNCGCGTAESGSHFS